MWLAADAPADLLDGLRAAGLVVTGERTQSSTLEGLRHGGPALAIEFLLGVMLVAVAVGMGAVTVIAGAERGARAGELRSLRAQGMRASVGWRVAFGGYLTVLLAALVVAVPAAALAWWLARDVTTYFVDGTGLGYVPEWPRFGYPLGLMGGAGLALIAVAAVAATALWWRVERKERR